MTEADGSVTNWTYDDVYRLLSETRVAGSSAPASLQSLIQPAATPTSPATVVPHGSGPTPPPSDTPSGPIDMLPGNPPDFAHIVPGAPAVQAGPTAAPSSTPSGSLPNTSSWTKSYTYDAVGNRLTQTANSVTTNYIYNALDQLTQASSSAQLAQYTYNGRGDLAFGSVQPTGSASTISTYTWDARDRMTSVSAGGTTLAAMAYDDGGHRIQTTFNGQVTNYLWDEASAYGDVIAEFDGSNALPVSYVLGGTELLTQTRGGTTSYYLHDGQNSVRKLTDTTGIATDTYTYDAYGNLQNRSGSSANVYQYAGQQFDSATGLYDLRARYYDAGVGRFGSQDPFIGNETDPSQIDRYSYSADNPINAFDPTGQELDYSQILRDAVTKTTNAALGVKVATLYANILLRLLQFVPLAEAAACLVFTPPQTPAPGICSEGFAEAGSALAEATTVLKQLINDVFFKAEIIKKNLAVARYFIGGVQQGTQGIIWAISGENGADTLDIEKLLNVILKPIHQELATWGPNYNSGHSEYKIIANLYEKMTDGTIPRNSSLSVDLYTIKAPCTDCQSAIGKFIAESKSRFGITVNIAISYTMP